MKWFLFPFLMLTPAFSKDNNDGKFHICFFELDNTKTSQNFKNRIDKNSNNRLCKKKQEFSSTNTVVHCYQPNQEKGVKAFERMIQEITQSGDRCDGLVMSGHHTGNWYGGTGRIKLKDLEDLSCNPNYRKWFSNIKALWLDGCNTVTDNILQSSAVNIPTPDSETARVVGKEYSADSITRWAVTNTSQAYTASLDKNTLLSSRYLRMFPQTQIYGFNGASPEGAKKGQASLIAQHLSLLGSALQAEANQNKHIKEIDRIKQALSAILSSDPCDEDKLEAWEKAGWETLKLEAVEQQDYKKAYNLGCNLTLAKQVLDNPHSEKNQKALANYIKNLMENKTVDSNKKLLELANELLNNPSSKKAVELAKKTLLHTLDEITSEDTNIKEEDKTYTHLLFHNIYDTWKTAQKYKTEDEGFYQKVQKTLQADNFKISLKERIESNQTASLKKGDYIKFYMEVNRLTLSNIPACDPRSNQPPPCLRTEIQKLVQKAESVFEGLSSPRQSELPEASRRALAVSVVDQLFQYDLLTKDQIKSLLTNKDLFPNIQENPFVTEVMANLSLSYESEKKQSMQKLEKGTLEDHIRPLVLRSLSRKYLQNPSKNLQDLQTVADSIDLDNDSERDIFWNAIHTQFSNYTQEQKENFIVEYSKKSSKNLEELLLWYADAVFSPDRKKEICKKLSSKSIQTHNLGYVCKG